MKRILKFTLTHDSNDFPYLASKASLMSPKSISDLETMIRMRVLSLVPGELIREFFWLDIHEMNEEAMKVT